jgi:ribose-phosphate pyrophosphokinase
VAEPVSRARRRGRDTCDVATSDRGRDGDAPVVVCGSGSPLLGAAVCAELGIEPAAAETLRFSEGTIFVRLLENVRGRHVYVVQSTIFPTNDNVVELLFWLDACRRASAASVTAIVPYFSYGKGDKKDEPRVSIRARVIADAIEAAGADRVVTMDLHAPQIQGFFHIPVDDLYAMPYLCEALKQLGLRDPVVVSPDAGYAKMARRFAHRLGAGFALADKARPGHGEEVEVFGVIGDVEGRDAVLVDDFVASGGTLIEAAEKLVERGARSVVATASHGVFSADATAKIEASAIERVIVTDSVESHPVPLGERVHVISVAPLFAEAIRRIHGRESISVLFREP